MTYEFICRTRVGWLLRAMVHLGLTALLLRPLFLALLAALLRVNPFHRLHPAAELLFCIAVRNVR